jgi:hypothetical protein
VVLDVLGADVDVVEIVVATTDVVVVDDVGTDEVEESLVAIESSSSFTHTRNAINRKISASPTPMTAATGPGRRYHGSGGGGGGVPPGVGGIPPPGGGVVGGMTTVGS